MKAGRELDVLIAEKVMGKSFKDKRYPDGSIWTGEQMRQAVPHYSTSIADAWEVFWLFTSRHLWFDDATDTWHCHLDSKRNTMDHCRHHAMAGDAPHAICLAALRAVGVPV